MDKQYWFVHYMINGKQQQIESNFGYVSDNNENMFSIHNLKKIVLKTYPNINPNTIVIRNFYEFERESDYINFWHK